MAQRAPSIACIGVIGKHNNPLHISIFQADDEKAARNRLEFSFMLSSCLDIFEARMPTKPVGQDFGLLQAIDERLAMYGWLTNTGVKLVIIVDMEGRLVQPSSQGKNGPILGLKNSDLTPAFRALQTAYINLLRNPFYVPDEHSPQHPSAQRHAGSLQINSKIFTKEVDRIGQSWTPEGLTR
ncbi:Sedlin [Myriangium duriaei CBS 260.36]|uniref:Sedlin n=1 Tax=Myriangium duriaei CBS 260.36 TaxID=1168546 RepID=A0A9P4J6G4_9PEZI|nr:Sedlin [Myriangium duriaei CBS 260.36]